MICERFVEKCIDATVQITSPWQQDDNATQGRLQKKSEGGGGTLWGGL